MPSFQYKFWIYLVVYPLDCSAADPSPQSSLMGQEDGGMRWEGSSLSPLRPVAGPLWGELVAFPARLHTRGRWSARSASNCANGSLQLEGTRHFIDFPCHANHRIGSWRAKWKKNFACDSPWREMAISISSCSVFSYQMSTSLCGCNCNVDRAPYSVLHLTFYRNYFSGPLL